MRIGHALLDNMGQRIIARFIKVGLVGGNGLIPGLRAGPRLTQQEQRIGAPGIVGMVVQESFEGDCRLNEEFIQQIALRQAEAGFGRFGASWGITQQVGEGAAGGSIVAIALQPASLAEPNRGDGGRRWRGRAGGRGRRGRRG